MNLQEHLSREQYRHLLRVASQEGCNYFTFNIPNTVCNDCGHIDKRNLKACPKCNGRNLDYLTRIIGYMKRVSNFSQSSAAGGRASSLCYAWPPFDVVFQEIPGEVTLALNLSGCPNRCAGCHSPHLWEEVGGAAGR